LWIQGFGLSKRIVLLAEKILIKKYRIMNTEFRKSKGYLKPYILPK